MGWRPGEVWFDVDVLWFREQGGGLALAGAAERREPSPLRPGRDGAQRIAATAAAAAAGREAQACDAHRAGGRARARVGDDASDRRAPRGGQSAAPLDEDPPTLTFRLSDPRLQGLELIGGASCGVRAAGREATPASRIEWNNAHSIGLPFSGRLVDGTQLPVEGPDWVTWNPSTDSSPNRADRLYGNERTIRAILTVVRTYRATHPDAPRVVVGDISRRGGGWMNEHVSHQNGLDVDVYYPRRDRRLSAPARSSQVDRRLAQDLLDRFLAAGAQIVFVGYSSGLRGPGGVVVPYPNHENHMHVRFPQPRG